MKRRLIMMKWDDMDLPDCVAATSVCFILFMAILFGITFVSDRTTTGQSPAKNEIIPLKFVEECGLGKELEALSLKPEEKSELLKKKLGSFMWEKPRNETNPGMTIGRDGCISLVMCGSSYSCTGFFFSDEKLRN
jgi:hypothetical protein